MAIVFFFVFFWQIFENYRSHQIFMLLFPTVIAMHRFWQKSGWLHLGRFFYKLILSPCSSQTAVLWRQVVATDCKDWNTKKQNSFFRHELATKMASYGPLGSSWHLWVNFGPQGHRPLTQVGSGSLPLRSNTEQRVCIPDGGQRSLRGSVITLRGKWSSKGPPPKKLNSWYRLNMYITLYVIQNILWEKGI
jgi:hypothetical protein